MSDWLLVDGARRLLADTCTHEAVQAAEVEGWSAVIWDALAASGYADLAGLGLADALAVLTVAGEHAAPVPLAEAALAGWLLGRSVEGSVSVVAPGGSGTLSLHDGLLSGTARRVPWGRAVERVVAVVDRQAVVIRTAVATRVERQTNLAGEPRDTVVFDRARVEEVRPAACDLNERGALTRAALMAGALGAMARLTIHYAGERRQFGRPIAAFQAVQQHLVSLAQDASLVALAAEHAVACPRAVRDRGGEAACLACCADGDARCPSGPRRDGDDAGVPSASLQPTAVGVAVRVRRRAALGALDRGRAGQGRRR